MKKIPLVWANLREWNGSLQTAFETICNHFAAYEAVPQGSTFVPVAPPDGGMESYWTFPNGTEWGFQAKFFTAKPDASEWGQIDKSVKRALDIHAGVEQPLELQAIIGAAEEGVRAAEELQSTLRDFEESKRKEISEKLGETELHKASHRRGDCGQRNQKGRPRCPKKATRNRAAVTTTSAAVMRSLDVYAIHGRTHSSITTFGRRTQCG